MSKFLDRALQFEMEYKHREHTPYLKGMGAYLTYLPILAWAQEHTESSKPLLLGLTAAMEGSVREESALGLFSPDFARGASLMARGLLLIEPKASIMQERLLSRLIMGSMTTLIGLLSAAKEEAEMSTTKASADIFLALLIRGVIHSGLPQTTLKVSLEACGISSAIGNTALETVALLALLLAFIPEQEAEQGVKQEELFEAVKERLEQNLEWLEKELTALNRNHPNSAPLILFLREGGALLNQRNYERFHKEFYKLLTNYNLSTEALKEDAEAAKRLFSILKTHFRQASDTEVNTISLVG